MARWKLTEKHYLNVPGTRWEFQTVDRMTGRPVRKTFNVPLFLDPEDKDSWNYRGEGMFDDGSVIVCHEGKGEPRDLIFIGDPTPGMLPMDAEAEAITAKFSWTPTQGIDEQSRENSYQNKLMLGLIEQMAEAQTKATSVQMAPGLEQLIAAMTETMAQQTQILAQLAGRGVVVQAAVVEDEQVIDEEPPLPEAEGPTREEIAESADTFRAAEAASRARAEAALAKSSNRRI